MLLMSELTPDNPTQGERPVAFGRAYSRAIFKYVEGENK